MSVTSSSGPPPPRQAATDRRPVPAASEQAEPPEGWVPVERRWHGLDRSTFRLALPVLVLAVLLAVVVPAVNAAVPGGTPVAAGQQVALSGDVAFSPAEGWTLTEGLLLGSAPRAGGYPGRAQLVDGAVTFSVSTARWAGTAAELLEQFRSTTDARNDRRALHVTGDPAPFTTAGGQVGVLASYRSTTTDGLAAALVLEGTGVVAVAAGPTDGLRTPSGDVMQMLTSITSTEEQR